MDWRLIKLNHDNRYKPTNRLPLLLNQTIDALILADISRTEPKYNGDIIPLFFIHDFIELRQQ